MNTMEVESKTPNNHNIYRGLYPIKEVKQYYKREYFKGKPLYICLWDDCGFKTWKYSQHIARHIHLKHIGIKELKCDEQNCEKTFKRPESLVQHQRNHLCGFGIDNEKMKDPSNVCGVKNIKKYYFRELDNDYYVFGCKWNECQFVTNNSGSIRRHIHNQHLCPHSVGSNGLDSSNSTNSLNNSNQLSINSSNSEVNLPLIEIIELGSQDFSPKAINNSTEDTIISQTIENPFTISAKPIIISDEIESNSSRRSSGGLYSLKNYSELYHKVKIDGEVYFNCNCNQFSTKSQISLVRHIWQELGRNVFECDIRGCDAKFDNEFNLYKHKKFDHNFDNSSITFSNSSTFDKPIDERVDNNNFIAVNKPTFAVNRSNSFTSITTVPKTVSPFISKTSFMSHKSNNILTRTRRSSSGIYSLKNFSRHFRKVRVNDQVYYKCECGQFTTKSSVSLVRHIWVHKGINSFECDLCNAKFDNESSLYRHRKFDHNSKNLPNFSNTPINYQSNYANANHSKPVVSNLPFDKFYGQRKSLSSDESTSLDVTQTATNSFISQTKPINNSDNIQTPPMSLNNIYASGSSGSGLYSLKNYSKYYKKLKINEEVCYKCTVCGFTSRSQVSLIRHIWLHTGMNRFECEDCRANFNSESDLYKHRKIHNTNSTKSPESVITTTPKSSNPNDIQMSANYIIINNDSFNGQKDYSIAKNEGIITIPKTNVLPKTIHKSYNIKTPSIQSQIRKIHTLNSKPGLYSLKTYESYFKKVKAVDGFNYVCNCGQFTSRSQVSLVRHIWLHQNSEQKSEGFPNGIQDIQGFNPVSNGIKLKATEESVPIITNASNFNGIEAQNTSISSNSQSRRNLTFKKYKFQSSPPVENAVEMQDTTEEISAEDLYFNNLIVKIEDRGYFCQWSQCDYSSDEREIVVSHIRESHMIGENDENDCMQTEYYENDIECYDNETNGNVSDYLMINNEGVESSEESSSQLETYSLENFEMLIDKERRNNALIYLCKADNCFFETALISTIVDHIRENHIIDTSLNRNTAIHDITDERTARNLNRFKCKFNYCNASFPSFGSLVEHQKIHGKQIASDSDIPRERTQRSNSCPQEVSNEYNTRKVVNKFKVEPSKSSKGYSYYGELGIQNADEYSEIVWESEGISVNICKWSNCGYKSYVRGNMIRHIRKHTGEKPFVCNINNCGQSFAYSTDVKIHQRRYH